MTLVKEDHLLTPKAATLPLPDGSARPLVSKHSNSVHGVRRLLNTAVPYLSRQVQSIGTAGVVGIALSVFALAFLVGANAPLRSELAQMQSSIDEAQRTHPGSHTPSAGPSAEIREFLNRLPVRSELPALTGRIVEQAAAAGITLERGTYDFSITRSGQLVRARMAFPVHGRYPDIRRFIDGSLAAIPGVAIDGLRFERKDIGGAEVDADIRFAIYLRGAK
jgi:hypothetical protein